MELNKIITGLLLISVVVLGIMLFFNEGVQEYAPTGYNSTNLNKFNESFNDLSQDVNQSYTDITEVGGGDVSFTDILGAIFTSGYQAAVTTVQAVATTGTLVSAGAAELPGGTGGFNGRLVSVLIAVILVIFGIGILLAFLIKSGRE